MCVDATFAARKGTLGWEDRVYLEAWSKSGSRMGSLSLMILPRSVQPIATLPRAYWVVEGKLLAGAYAGQPDEESQKKRLGSLFRLGVRTIVNLMESDERNPSGSLFRAYDQDFARLGEAVSAIVDCWRFPIVDQGVPTHEEMDRILDAIDRSLDEDRPVYVHCFGGIGQTGTVVSCWLLRHGYVGLENVFSELQRLRQADVERASRPAPENERQREFVRSWWKRAESQRVESIGVRGERAGDWFTRLVGFQEGTAAEVRAKLEVKGEELRSKVNGKVYRCGRLELASLGSIREQVQGVERAGMISVSEWVGDVRRLHADRVNAGAVFQVASQFNLLEMISPEVTPEHGITGYAQDPTQGPACAIACGAGTIYRQYFAELDGHVGQTKDHQIDGLREIGESLGNDAGRLWRMKNGYALPSREGLLEVDSQLTAMAEEALDGLRSKLRVGVQWETQVTLESNLLHSVTQVYGSAMPVSYSGLQAAMWERFARLILEASYEATLGIGVLNGERTGNRTVYLTLLGGGVFGNRMEWILDAIERACRCFASRDLDVRIVSFGAGKPEVQRLVERLRS